jgi:hypothetical protein
MMIHPCDTSSGEGALNIGFSAQHYQHNSSPAAEAALSWYTKKITGVSSLVPSVKW